MSEPTTSKLGLKLPESPNTAKEKQKCQLRNQMRGQVRTNDAVVGPLLEVRHDDIDLSVQNVETLCQDHCSSTPTQRQYQQRIRRDRNVYVHGVVSPEKRNRTSPNRLVICDGAFEVSLRLRSALASSD